MTAIEGNVDQIGWIAKVFDRAIIADLERLTTLPRPVDVIVLADVLEHLAKPEALLALAAETLDHDGAIVVSIPNIANLASRLGLLFGRFEYQDRGILDRTHLRFYTLSSARRLLHEAGLRIEAEETSSVPLDLALPWMPSILLGPLEWITDALTPLLPRLLGYQFIFVARKSER